MEEKLISKKELLDRYKISYGSLYRWKRMGLIPDDWFIKKSTVTGQETFFNEAVICERIELIINQKDSKSLEELAVQLNPPKFSCARLIINTLYGTKEFDIDDIKSIDIVGDKLNGEIKELAKTLSSMLNDLILKGK